MKKINSFGIEFKNSSTTPFFQVGEKNRIRFGMDVFEGNAKTLKKIIDFLFVRNEEIESSFIIGDISNLNNKIRYNKIGLNKFLKINNWKETSVVNDDLKCTIVFASVKNINKNDVFSYCKSIVLGRSQSYIMFYNDTFLLYVSSDVLDIISKEEDNIDTLKINYSDIYDKRYAQI
ncbi:hypothetical protein MPH48_11055 [Lysinibacillus fusiformis]|uniref:hypothetical protein n=1 Tax=Lysinibacillus fusiformis TaxID=28031 RepID=UPI001F4D8A8D|nr:hypothetical protein [Lysinibacillus fusiformis]MCK1988640.1 hypothetical protein [Lysinibacillus fusiformis]